MGRDFQNVVRCIGMRLLKKSNNDFINALLVWRGRPRPRPLVEVRKMLEIRGAFLEGALWYLGSASTSVQQLSVLPALPTGLLQFPRVPPGLRSRQWCRQGSSDVVLIAQHRNCSARPRLPAALAVIYTFRLPLGS